MYERGNRAAAGDDRRKWSYCILLEEPVYLQRAAYRISEAQTESIIRHVSILLRKS